MPKDMLGNELRVGDRVVYIEPYYHELKVGEITGFTPCNVRIGVLLRSLTNVVKIPSDNSVVLSKSDYEDLLFYDALCEAGVDNWEGYEIAQALYEEKYSRFTEKEGERIN